MKKSEFILDSGPEDDYLAGHCSSCPNTKFRLQDNTLEHKTLLRKMFDSHFKRVHLQEDASQA
jgi:hypothetical protein